MVLTIAKGRRLIAATTILLGLVCLITWARLTSFDWPENWHISSSGHKAWIFRGPYAEDKVVVIAKIHDDDVNWVTDELWE